MSKRKTVHLQTLVDEVNSMLRYVKTPDAAISLCVLLERILMDAGQYNGFRFIDEHGKADLSDTPISCGDPGYWRREYYGPKDHGPK